MSGEMRRPPQLWEQRLARTTSVLGVGISSSGDATAIVPPTPPPGAGGGTEPAPVLPAPGAFIKPSTPQLIGGLQGINVLWDGLNSAGDLWPYDTSWVEVHMATTGTAFTPGTATLKGRLARPGALFVGGLTAGSAYYFKLRGADPAGNYTEASDAATGFTGLTTASDYGTATIGTGAVSFNARTIGGVTNTVGATAPSSPLTGDIWLDSSPGTAIVHKIWNGSTWVTNAWGSASIAAGQITALQIAAGAVTAGAIAAGAVTTDKLTAGTISGFYISGGTIAGGYISGGTLNAGYISGGTIASGFVSGGTISASDIRTGTSGRRVSLTPSTFAQGITYENLSTGDKYEMGIDISNRLDINGTGTKLITTNCDIDSSGGLDVSNSAVFMQGVYDNNTTGIDEVGITTAYRLRRISSSQAIKYDIAALTAALSTSVEADRICDVVTVDPTALLNVAVTEFSVIDDGEPTERRVLGFIAEDVADKLPIAVSRDADGNPAGVLNTSLLAALLAVVQTQQEVIEDLTSRIEALEA